jgi:ribosomal protein L16 Arg81 hydroxylase
MKKTLLILSLFLLVTGFTFKDTYVYICKGKGSRRYHLVKNCRGLKPCKSTINKVTKMNAEKVGLTLCKWED